MSRKIHALGVVGILAAAVYGINRNSHSNTLESHVLSAAIAKQEPAFRIHAPVYDDSIVPSNNCSRYVRLAAKDLFGINYPSDDAWNLRNYTSGVEVERVSNLREMFKSDKIKGGDILAVYNPTSKYNSRDAAKKAGYTHVMIYLGLDETGEPIFADKFGSKTRTHMTVAEIERSNLKPIEILHPKKR